MMPISPAVNFLFDEKQHFSCNRNSNANTFTQSHRLSMTVEKCSWFIFQSITGPIIFHPKHWFIWIMMDFRANQTIDILFALRRCSYCCSCYCFSAPVLHTHLRARSIIDWPERDTDKRNTLISLYVDRISI